MLFENAYPQDTSLAGDLCKGSDRFCPVKKSRKVDIIVFLMVYDQLFKHQTLDRENFDLSQWTGWKSLKKK